VSIVESLVGYPLTLFFLDEFFRGVASELQAEEPVPKGAAAAPMEASAEATTPQTEAPSPPLKATVAAAPTAKALANEVWADLEAALVAEVLTELPPRPRGEREEWVAHTGCGSKEDVRPGHHRHRHYRHH
jgi:hypothetical protein